MKNQKSSTSIYLDYAAATPIDPKVKQAMEPFLHKTYGNPSSLHKKGTEARAAVEDARKTIADIINGRPEEIIFTSGGTESCNLAVLGMAGRGHVITSTIEHHAVLEPVLFSRKQGSEATFLKVDGEGLLNPHDLEKAVRPKTRLVSIMYANNEIGTIQNIGALAKIIASFNVKRLAKGQPLMAFHTDACQAAGSLDLNVNRLGVDLMSVSASKIYGPKGAGFLYVRKETPLSPVTHGGGQEKGFRPGTENVAGIVGLAKALELAQTGRGPENQRLVKLRDYFIKYALKIPGVKLNGSLDNRLPNNINLSVKGVEGEALMLYLDAAGICVSTASACSTGGTERSHVIKSIGVPEEWARGTLRLTLGKNTTQAELSYVLKILPKKIKILRTVKF